MALPGPSSRPAVDRDAIERRLRALEYRVGKLRRDVRRVTDPSASGSPDRDALERRIRALEIRAGVRKSE